MIKLRIFKISLFLKTLRRERGIQKDVQDAFLSNWNSIAVELSFETIVGMTLERMQPFRAVCKAISRRHLVLEEAPKRLQLEMSRSAANTKAPNVTSAYRLQPTRSFDSKGTMTRNSIRTS